MKPVYILVFAAMLPQALNAQFTRKDNFLSQLKEDVTVSDTLTADQREFDYAYELWEEQPILALSAFKGIVSAPDESQIQSRIPAIPNWPGFCRARNIERRTFR